MVVIVFYSFFVDVLSEGHSSLIYVGNEGTEDCLETTDIGFVGRWVVLI